MTATPSWSTPAAGPPNSPSWSADGVRGVPAHPGAARGDLRAAPAGVRRFVFGGYTPTPDAPVLVLIGGQTAAGKTYAVDTITARHDRLVPINGDELRAFHPRYRHIMRTEPLEMTGATGQAAGAWIGRSLDYALEHRYSVLLEGTFRNPLMVVQTAQRFKKAGYQVEAVGLAVAERTSLLSTVDRFLAAPETAARWTHTPDHDLPYRMVPATLQALEDSPDTYRLDVTNRAGDKLFTNIRTPTGEWADPTPGVAAASAKRERDKPPSPQEARDWLEAYTATTRELAVRGHINATTWPTVERLGGLAQTAAGIAFPHAPEARQALSEHFERLAAIPHDTSRELPHVPLPETAPQTTAGPRRRRTGLSAARIDDPPAPTRSQTPQAAEPPPQHHPQRRPGHGPRP
ncbi:zeta toxin family protein [Nocardiopsis dassonvillei]|uniref:zeta toxin family protein n=1 Tax=Nocardiopsis dassonvillei TaxID=2014 RepID=UPI0033C42AA1